MAQDYNATEFFNRLFWCPDSIPRRRDIARLRPPSLKKGERFETVEDARNERLRRETLLAGLSQAAILAECGRTTTCFKPYCPLCARTFRRWFIGELFRAISWRLKPMRIATILMESAAPGDIGSLNIRRCDARLRKRLQRSGLGDAVAIGGWEVAYRAKDKRWILHTHLLISGADKKGRKRLKKQFRADDLERAVVFQKIKNPASQLSYLLKFATYHRPHEQAGRKKAASVPLNAREHTALVKWMHQRRFQDFVFLFNARRFGSEIRSMIRQV